MRRKRILARMEQINGVVPWVELVVHITAVEPAKASGCLHLEVDTMQRLHLLNRLRYELLRLQRFCRSVRKLPNFR